MMLPSTHIVTVGVVLHDGRIGWVYRMSVIAAGAPFLQTTFRYVKDPINFKLNCAV